ncbi:unnamed protein product [Cuscuta campestris]|uniref:Small EDRK-rich factor-like N-terminal domain-containing protein n=1 Tax=Cuscuta campestris TaxID=132261 RepID=A0A484NJ19_9ASTE|nr:unnamed protein product [Cuscuta campestris]
MAQSIWKAFADYIGGPVWNQETELRDYLLQWGFLLLCGYSAMTLGNQREKDRERAQARNGSKNSKNKDDGLTPEQRRERDGKALQEKAAKKAAQAEAAGGSKENKGTAKNSSKK